MAITILYCLAVAMGFLLLGVFLKLRSRLTPEVLAAAPYFWLIALSSFYELVFTYWLRIDATLYFRLYSLLEFLTLLYFFNVIVPRLRIMYLALLAIYMVPYAIMMFFYDRWDMQDADQVLSFLTTIMIYACSIGWFRHKFLNPDHDSLLQSGAFYIVSGSLIYFSATIFLFLLSKYIYANDREHFTEYWLLNIVMVLLIRILYIVSIWKGQKISSQYSGQARH